MSEPDIDESSVSKAEYEALAAFRYALRRFVRFSETQATAAGLTPQQHQALLAIVGMPGREVASVGEIAERLQIRPHSAVGLISRLEVQGLVTRELAPDDRRRVLVRVAPGGYRLLAALTHAHKTQVRRIGPELLEIVERLSATRPDSAS